MDAATAQLRLTLASALAHRSGRSQLHARGVRILGTLALAAVCHHQTTRLLTLGSSLGSAVVAALVHLLQPTQMIARGLRTGVT